jgi:hypothetical protein
LILIDIKISNNMADKKFQKFLIDYEVSYDNCEFIIQEILRHFDAKIIKNIYDNIETIYCDFLIKKSFKICLHYHGMVGLVIIALTKESEQTAKEVADFIISMIGNFVA